MTGKIKFALILTSVILVIVAVTTVGVSLALWTKPGGIGGDSGNSVSPSVAPIDEYVWAKYFQYKIETVTEGDKTTEYAVVTKFYTDSIGINLEDVVIPSRFVSDETYTYIDKDGNEQTANKVYPTYRISGQVFMDTTLKKLPVTVYIPSSVMHIDSFAFGNLPNLRKVVFLGGEEKQACNIGDYAFAFCQNLIEVQSERDLVGNTNAFVGCKTTPTMTAPTV